MGQFKDATEQEIPFEIFQKGFLANRTIIRS
jgi:hypothetical protein